MHAKLVQWVSNFLWFQRNIKHKASIHHCYLCGAQESRQGGCSSRHPYVQGGAQCQAFPGPHLASGAPGVQDSRSYPATLQNTSKFTLKNLHTQSPNEITW